jgi:prepilin peptidase CpaA
MPYDLYAYTPYIALIVACIFASIFDVRSRKIPNAIPISLVVAAFIFKAMHGPAEFGIAVSATIALLLLGSLAFSLHILGGGDVKLLAAGCAFLPPSEMPQFLLSTALGGGMLALMTACTQRTLKTSLQGAFTIMHGIRIDPTTAIAPATRTSLPYAIAITFGAISVTLIHTFSPTGLRVI